MVKESAGKRSRDGVGGGRGYIRGRCCTEVLMPPDKRQRWRDQDAACGTQLDYCAVQARTGHSSLTNRDRSGALRDPHLAEHSWRILCITRPVPIIDAVGARTVGNERLVSVQTRISQRTAFKLAAWCWEFLVPSEKACTSVLVCSAVNPRRTWSSYGPGMLHPQPVE